MGGTLKRLSLTFWIFAGMAAGVAVGALGSGLCPASGTGQPHFSAADPLDHRPAAVRHAGARHRRVGRHQADGAHRAEGHSLFRNRHHAGAVPGVGRREPGAAGRRRADRATAADAAIPAAQAGFKLENIVPTSIIDAMARNDALQIVVFAFLFGTACSAIGAKADPVVKFCGSLAEVMFRFTKYVMYMAPLGVGAAIAITIGSKGVKVLFGLGQLIATMYVSAVIVHSARAVPGLLYSAFRYGKFYRAVREPFLIGFSTASSEAALPLALENMEQFGVPGHIVGFVIPTGYSFNLSGQRALFVAGVDLRGAGRGHASHDRRATGHDADADADQQGRGGSSALGAGDSGRHGRNVPPAEGGNRGAARRGRHPRYGAHFD
jgi:proton glutamate symport protein